MILPHRLRKKEIMTSYPEIVEVTLTRFYEYEVLNPEHPLTLGIKQALASEIAIVYNKTDQLAFLNQQYMNFRVREPQILSDEELDTIPRSVFFEMLDFIQTDEDRFRQLLNHASQNGLSLMLQLLLYSHKNCCSFDALMNAAQQAGRYQHAELIPIFKHWVFKLDSERKNIEGLLPAIAALDISLDKDIAQRTADSVHSDDSTKSLHILQLDLSVTNAGSREHSESEDETDPINYLDRPISFTPSYEKTQKAPLSVEPTLQHISESAQEKVSTVNLGML